MTNQIQHITFNTKCLQKGHYNSFGSIMPGREYMAQSVGGYRFGFNTQEKDDEIYGKGNASSAQFWEYHTRLGRRWNKDPVTTIWESPYNTFANNPIAFIDHLGDDISYGSNKKEAKEIKRDIRYKKRHDKEFREKWAELKKTYTGKDSKDLQINKNETSKNSLDDLKITDSPYNRPNTNKNKDFLSYSSLKGPLQSTYTVFEVTFKETTWVGANVERGTSSDWVSSVVTQIPQKYFNTWTTTGNWNDGLTSATTRFGSPNTVSSSVHCHYSNLQKKEYLADGRDHNGLVNDNFVSYCTAHSIPIIVKVPRNGFNQLNWRKATYGYRTLAQETAIKDEKDLNKEILIFFNGTSK